MFTGEKNQYYQGKIFNQAWLEDIPSDFEDITVTETFHPTISTDEQDNDNGDDSEDKSVKDRGLPSDKCLQPVDIGQEILDQYFDKIFVSLLGKGIHMLVC